MNNKIETKLDEIKEYVETPLPEYSDYDKIFDNSDEIKKELIKWSQEKIKCSRHYSEAKTIFIYIDEMKKDEVDPKDKLKFEEKVKSYKNRLQHMCDILKSRLFAIDSVIESTRSLQSHSMSQPDFE